MLKKIAVVCCLIMLLSTMAVAAPAKGKFVVTAPILGINALAGLGDYYDGYGFGDGGSISLFGTSQFGERLMMPMVLGTPWSVGYTVINNLEVGLNIGYLNIKASDEKILNLGLFGAYYFGSGKLMPFVKLGLTLVDVTDDPDTLINTSIGLAYAASQTVAPYVSLDFDTTVDTGTVVSLTFGLKFMF